MSDSKHSSSSKENDALAVQHDEEHFHPHYGLYWGIAGTLLVCTGLTVALAFFDAGHEGINIFLGLALATFKAALVVAIFMHMKGEKKFIFQVMIPTMVLFFVLFGLCLFAYYDPIRF